MVNQVFVKFLQSTSAPSVKPSNLAKTPIHLLFLLFSDVKWRRDAETGRGDGTSPTVVAGAPQRVNDVKYLASDVRSVSLCD